MHAKLFSAVLAMGALSGIAFAGDKPQAAPQRQVREGAAGGGGVDKALHAYYGPTAKAHITSDFIVNGVHVFNATVDRDGAIAQATLTEGGDYITMGIPEAMNTITPGAAETAQLFKTPPVSIIREDIHGFFVTVKGPGHGLYTIQLDATGRIRNIQSANQLAENAEAPKVGGPQAHHVEEVTMKRFSGVQVEGVFTAVHDPGYFNVPFHNKDGHGWAIISENNDVAEWRYPERIDALPPVVRQAIERELHGDRIVNIEQGAARLYQITQGVSGEEVKMLVNSAGSVVWISSRELHRPTLREAHEGVRR